MNRKKAVRVILWLIVLAVLVGIFLFSAQNSDESDNTSSVFLRAVLKIFPFFNKMEPSAQDGLVESVMYAVRKLAHFSLYAFLGFWTHFLIKSYSLRFSVLLAGVFSGLYAVTDEIHQLFVPGRSGNPLDVCIDAAGAVTGAAFSLLLIIIWQKLKKHKFKTE